MSVRDVERALPGFIPKLPVVLPGPSGKSGTAVPGAAMFLSQIRQRQDSQWQTPAIRQMK